MPQELAERRCKPCEGGYGAADTEQARELMRALHADWSLSEDGLSIARSFRFPAYARRWNLPMPRRELR